MANQRTMTTGDGMLLKTTITSPRLSGTTRTVVELYMQFGNKGPQSRGTRTFPVVLLFFTC